MYTLTLSEIIDLKHAVEKNFGTTIHLCDRCGGQAIRLEQSDETLRAFIADYFDRKNLSADFSEDGLTCSVRKKQVT